MISQWIQEIKATCPPEGLGMILIHNGVVRATSKKGDAVQEMQLSYDREALDRLVQTMKAREGVADIRVWINEGHLKIGDDIMAVCVAGRFRTDVLPVFEELISTIKREIVKEKEL